jgi:Tetrapyrrole (Corrin/Porphyrin) Methylases
MRQYLSGLKRPLVNLESIYRDGELDLIVYERIADTIIKGAQKYKRVSFILPGHPLIYVAPTAMILEKAKRLGISTSVLPGISSIDTMVLQLNLDIANFGVQVFESNRFIYYGIKPDPRVPLFLFQPGGVGTGVLTQDHSNRPRRFKELLDALLETYPASHRCCLLTSPHEFARPGRAHWFALGRLCSKASQINYYVTLYVPPSAEFRLRRAKFVSKLYDRRHANELIRGKISSA